MKLARLLTLCILGVALAQGEQPPTAQVPPVLPAARAYALEPVAEELPLPVSVRPLGDGSGRLLLVSLEGQIWLLDDGRLSDAPFLNLAARVTGRLGEQGLFSVALERQDDGRPGRLVAAFSEKLTGDLVVAAYPVAADLSAADQDRETEIIRVPMPEPFHHGGQVAFGPDGYLYVSVGSGESSPQLLHVLPAPAQDLSRLLGKLLRLDVSVEPYAVPADNPFTEASDPVAAAAGARPEIWASGFRNPWKFTFSPSGQLYLTDVGEDRWEEVNLVQKGANYGWPAREGHECLLLPDAPGYVYPDCPQRSFAQPLVVYGHLTLDPQGGQSITGGVVAADPSLPELAGSFVYGDFVSGQVWAYDPVSGRVQLLLNSGLPLTEVSAGADGELLLVGVNGVILRLVHAPSAAP